MYLFALSFAFRLLNAHLNTAYFQPDEYFQVWEPAFFAETGRGWLTWEWLACMRTTLLVYVFRALIKLSKLLKCDYLMLGRVFMALVASLIDLYTYKLALTLTRNKDLAKSAFLVSLTSLFNWYVSTRPFSNTFETLLTLVALQMWISGGQSIWLGQVFAHIAIALRPTNAIVWIQMALEKVVQMRSAAALKFVLKSVLLGVLVQGIILGIDAASYGSLVVPYYEFYKHNIGANLSVLYGANSLSWYFTQAIPFMLMGYLPAIVGLRDSPKLIWRLLALNLIVMSLVVHKEFRFIYFLLPLMHIAVAYGLKKVPKLLVWGGILLNCVLGIYLSMFHKHGVMDLTTDIRNSQINDISFLMPCHSTPWEAHFQRNNKEFSPKFLTCNPPWNVTEISSYKSEQEMFYEDPKAFLEIHPTFMSEYVAVYEPLRQFMLNQNYEEVKNYNNGLFSDDSDQSGRVYLMKRIYL